MPNDTTVVPLLDSSGKPYRHVATRNDITERKRAGGACARDAALKLLLSWSPRVPRPTSRRALPPPPPQTLKSPGVA
ncbi:MAG TPA: hypothetical protein VIP46_20930 [Pyrinomonadaceae bacterium]